MMPQTDISQEFSVAADITRAAQAWRNPRQRLELPLRLSQTISTFSGAGALLGRIAEGLEAHGRSLADVGRVYIAYPHKHPDFFPAYKNGSANTAQSLKDMLRAAAPAVAWKEADEICETVRLDRSEDQSAMHALTSKQVYQIRQAEGLPPFLSGLPKGERAFFIIADSSVEQGTTIANLASYIHHNGGVVLAAAVPDKSVALAQKRAVQDGAAAAGMEAAFRDANRNTGRLAELAEAMGRTSGGISPAECLSRFEAAINRCGNSVFAMTDGECNRLITTLRGETHYLENFNSLMSKLARKAEAPAPSLSLR